ncbi:MAG: hypothetical protein KAS85_03645 [Rhodobacteraceae bacterium]|nr:hypothetical protein [Paracoccaceae bacterium]
MKTKKLVLAALTVTLLGSGAVFAQGNSNGNGASNNGNNGRGAIASELKWRNAAHASAQAFLNASPDSAVGKLATLVNTTNALEQGYADALVDLVVPIRTSEEIAAEILLTDAALLADSEYMTVEDYATLVQEHADAVVYEDAKAAFEATPEFLEMDAAETAAEVVVGIGIGEGELSADAVEALWGLLEGK